MTERLARKEVAARLRELADRLSDDEDLELEHGGQRFSVAVPDEIGLEIELDLERDDEPPDPGTGRP